MLESLSIKNFKLLKNLTLPSLGRVNLIIGRNNTGKSSVLEAVSVYASKGDIVWLKELLEQHGESVAKQRELSSLLEIRKAFISLFYGYHESLPDTTYITIGSSQSDTQDGTHPASTLSMRLVYYYEERILQSTKDENPLYKRTQIIVSEKEPRYDVDAETDTTSQLLPGIEIGFNNETRLYPLGARFYRGLRYGNKAFKYLTPTSYDHSNNAAFWDAISLTEKEEHVIRALQIIEPRVERLAFVSEDDSFRSRHPVAKLQGTGSIVPLKSMGDGINRILTIVLAAVNSDNSYLLIDEFENGLHYAVQHKLWEVIFFLAEKLNIQVFATTHSNDCIQAFGKLISDKHADAGRIYRLDTVDGDIIPTEFTAKDISIATQMDIEVR